MKGKVLFVKNAALLTVSSLILKTAGMALRVWLSAHLLGEGLGLYQLILSVYMLAANPLTSGFSVAVTKLASEGRRRADRVIRVGGVLALVISAAAAAGVFLGADFISTSMLFDARAALSLKILPFSLPFMALSAVMKGYFIARRNTVPHTVSQLIEQAVRIVSVIFFVSLWSGGGIGLMCAGVLLGDCVAEAASFAVIAVWAAVDSKRLSGPVGAPGTAKAVVKVAAPIAGERAVTTSFHAVENLLVPTLAAAVSGTRDAAVAKFGVLKGMAIPLLFFPSSFLGVISTLLIPEVSEAMSNGRSERLKSAVENTFHIVIILSILLSALFLFLAEEWGIIIYKSADAAYMIRVLAPIVPFMYCESIADGMMKGMYMQVRAFVSGLIDAAARIALVALAVPKYGIDGFLAVMVVSNVLACIYKMSQVMKAAGTRVNLLNWVIKPTAAALAAGTVSSAICGGMGLTNKIVYTAAATVILVAVFAALAVITGAIPKLKKLRLA